MKRRSMLLFLMIFLTTTMLAPVSFAEPLNEISLYLNGKKLPAEVAPYIDPEAEVTMVPLRVISESLGAEVKWTQHSRTVDIYREDSHISMSVDNHYARVDGRLVELEASVQLYQNTTMVPVRFIAEELGIQVFWNQSTRSVLMWTKDQADTGADAEMRGAWISTVYNLDWPSASSYGNASEQQQQFEKLLDDLLVMGLNTVFVQVRPSGDALYPSTLVPWSKYLTGTQGQDPGYDPLAFMIEAAHERGMEFHAWFNPFRANTDNKREGLAPQHVVNTHPEWIVEADKKLFINPGIPEARQHIISAIMEVVTRYDIDGVHLDDYFYPSNVAFPDDTSYSSYNPNGLDRASWRRSNINDFVQQLGVSIKEAKPQVEFGVSPFGVWRNHNVDPTGSATRAGVSTYDHMFADVRTWVQQEWIDYVMPQLYWSMSFEVARYDKLVDWWVQEVAGTNVDLYIGHSPYKIGTKESGWHTAQEIINQLEYNKQYPQIKGDVFFSAKDLRRNPLGIVELLRGYYVESGVE
ncbi:family 10 glycosylhydrolase [Paenibacillus senegalensis]|uniref:family 10 glycosylhydrolase n=1 Tax=Paenibacillus senegalensis TaxID=1465766 RepID=UPI0002885891|nr:family 10 glycosylhydrolase [Paenibacillus senegalensis]